MVRERFARNNPPLESVTHFWTDTISLLLQLQQQEPENQTINADLEISEIALKSVTQQKKIRDLYVWGPGGPKDIL